MTVSVTAANRRWWILATMTGSLSMVALDQTVVSVALPTMQRDLGLTPVGVQWVVNAYLLVLAVLVALGGRLGDLFGTARTFRLGALVFVLASAACGLAQSELWIIAARGIQGAGAALMVPASGSIVLNAFAPKERGRAMGIYSGVSMIFLALGPLIGGVLTQGVTWRAVFFVNLPIGIAMLAAAHTTLPNERPQDAGGKIDWLGIPLLVGGLTALVLGLMQGGVWGWSSTPTIILFAAAFVMLPTFVAHEYRALTPLVHVRVFSNANFTADGAVLAAMQFALTGISVFGAIWVQDVLGFGAIQAGVSLLPLTIPVLIVAPRAGRLYDRIGPRIPVAGGALLVALSFAWQALVLHHEQYGWLVPGYALMGLGIGLVMSPASTDSLNVVVPAMRSQASGVVQTLRQVGGTFGIAILGAIVASKESANLTRHASPATVHHAGTVAVASAYWVAAGVMLLATAVAATMLRKQAAADATPTPSESTPTSAPGPSAPALPTTTRAPGEQVA